MYAEHWEEKFKPLKEAMEQRAYVRTREKECLRIRDQVRRDDGGWDSGRVVAGDVPSFVYAGCQDDRAHILSMIIFFHSIIFLSPRS